MSLTSRTIPKTTPRWCWAKTCPYHIFAQRTKSDLCAHCTHYKIERGNE